jgi:hypothetical protein
MIRSLLLMSTALAAVAAGPAFADEYGSANQGQITIQQATSMMAYSAGNDQAQVSIAPNWSDELGWSVRAAAGSYLGDAVALGAIVEYGDNKQEYLANLGFQLSETLSLIGTIGQLAEHKEFIAEEGEDKASQMEYGLSLKGHLQDGLGFEFNGYSVNSKAANEDIETAKLYGTEALATLGLADSTLLKIGGGYEWLEWDGGEKDNRWTFRSEANHRLTDMLALQGHTKLGASERSYGGGLNFNLSNTGNNILGINYTQIEGRHGISDDKRVELSWTYGFGAGPASHAAAMDEIDADREISPAADVATVAPANNLLGDMMKRPEFLPKRVLARAKNAEDCPFYTTDRFDNRTNIFYSNFGYNMLWIFVPNGIDYPSSVQLGAITLAWVGLKIPQTTQPDGTIYQYEAPPGAMNENETLTIPDYSACTTDLVRYSDG